MESDEQVAARVQQGHSDAFGVLIERYQEKLLRYARKFLLDRDDASDIVQDVFIKTYENIQSFDTTRRFSPWIYRIAHNEFVNDLKKKKSRPTVFDFDIDTILPNIVAPDTADSVAMERDMRKILEEKLDRLDAKYREPVVLYYLQGLEYRDIAEILHVPVSTVGVRLARARAMLKNLAEGKSELYE